LVLMGIYIEFCI